MYQKDNHATTGAHASAPPGCIIAGRYEVVRQAGTGNFARVFECIDKTTDRHVAVKLLKRGFERDADFECDILRGINKHDPEDNINIVKLIEKTTWNGIATIVFNLKGAPLKVSTFPFDHRNVARVAYDIGKALSFLHFTVRAVHTDLKPENILAEKAGSSISASWSICDLGSASFYTSRLDTDLITTRPYRAPEVVLKKGWSYPADTWSLGCILYEIRTNKKLFDCHTDGDHITMMNHRIGAIPGQPARMPSARYPHIRDELRNEDADFVDLLLMMLVYDPAKRIKCSEIEKHPYVTRQMGSVKVPIVPVSRPARSNSNSTPSLSVDSDALRGLTRAMAGMKINEHGRKLSEIKASIGNVFIKPETTMRQKPSLISPASTIGINQHSFRLKQKC
eukprot:Tbor_TRINITY_DN2262_c0_g1::TRINITY_DN2262_c0_g1_i1::g.2714::m.2714/K08823/CLK; CDC-like kinase